MTMTASSLARGRELFEGQRWEDVHALLSEVDRDHPLEAEELVRLATSAQMLGREAEAASAWSRAHTEFLKHGEIAPAVRCVYGLVISMLLRGEMAQAGGWIARAQRLLQNSPPESAEHGFVLCAVALRSTLQGDIEAALASFVEASRIGERAGEADLVAQARMGEGRILIRLNETARGAALLDEVMAAVTASAVSPLVSGGIYCSVLEACHEMFDLRRAREWTDAMTTWCARQPDSLGFRGLCLIHRAELMQLNGSWSGASDEAQRARDQLMRPPPHGAVGAAHYRIAELHRVRGDFAAAEEEYRTASRSGFDPQPGLALLRLAQGRTASAMSVIARAMEESRTVQRRARLIPAFVEIAIEVAEVAGARAAAEELAGLAAVRGTPLLRASAAQAMGAVLLAEGNARGALRSLRDAFALWRDLEAPYDAARTRVLIARACRAVEDADTAALELAGAREAFAELGAAHDVATVAAAERAHASTDSGDELTPREREVLRLVATGKTNRAIAATLGISEKTIARHVSNIFTKLGLASRAAATAYAYEHDLFGRAT